MFILKNKNKYLLTFFIIKKKKAKFISRCEKKKDISTMLLKTLLAFLKSLNIFLKLQREISIVNDRRVFFFFLSFWLAYLSRIIYTKF